MINKKLVWRCAARLEKEEFTINELIDELTLEAGRLELVETKTYYEIDTILKTVCNALSVEASEVKSRTRKRDIVHARQIAMHLTYKYTMLSSGRTGELFNRDHATTLHAIKNVKFALKGFDAELKEKIERCEKYLLMEKISYTKSGKCITNGCDNDTMSRKAAFCKKCYSKHWHREKKQKLTSVSN